MKTRGLLIFLGATVARAHPGGPPQPESWWRAWDFDPLIVAGLFFTAALYASGLAWLRRATDVRGKLRREAVCFFAGWLTLVVALISPVHPIGGVLFSVHMIQHELLMVIAAPLLVLGRPALVVLWAFPRRAARVTLRRARALGAGHLWAKFANPFGASLLHAVALWVWHVPALFDATTTSESVHMAQHISFLVTALLFWHAVFFGPRREAGNGLAVLYLFLTSMHSGALGALITFASTVWYSTYATAGTAAWGLSALEDQQLGGLIMWVPAGLVYVVAALILFARWLQASERRQVGRVATMAVQ